ncbi:surfactin synthase thioesterase subunit [Streptomyces sp. BK208]|uniref:thioesterase II family protein n=1 Tax=Streptomyces sp. BK208 TaxID=2512150 RepID=UPI00105D8B59|nr:alpha/beta fold hydrolase [Streptomyces sp. BK208]TDT42696.1 surfactin synthase thioesterase subunit [Streptomyces sp. BK208]
MTAILRPRRLDTAAMRLAVCHHAGGSATAYVPLVGGLPADWDALLVDLPERAAGRADPLPWDLEGAVKTLTQELSTWTDGTPLALFGHSLGALVAFETARALEECGVPVAWVGVSGRRPPDDAVPVPPLDPSVPDEELAAALTRLGGLPERLDAYPEIRHRFLKRIRNDLRALEGYRPQEGGRSLAAPLTAFGAADDPLAPAAALAGWARHTTGSFATRVLAGGHFGLFADGFADFVPVLIDEVCRPAPWATASASASVGAYERT